MDFHDPKSVKVCVIGSGFAGLSVAYHLLKHNEAAKNFDGSTYGSPLFDIEILEARDRIGGRVYPSNLGTGDAPIMVDMGAQWLHEAGPDNPLVQLLRELNIPLLYAQKEREAEQQQQQQQQQNNQEEEKNNSAAAGEENDNHNNQKVGAAVESGTYTMDGMKIPDDIFIAARNFYSKSKNNYKRKNITLNTSFQDLLNEAYQKKMNKIAEKNNKDNAATEGEEEEEEDDEGYATAQSEVESDSSSSSSSSSDNDDDDEEDDDDDEEDQTGETDDDDDSTSSGSSSSSDEDDDDDDEEGEDDNGGVKKANKSDNDNKFAKCFSNPLFEQTVNQLVHSTECYKGGRLHEISVALDDLYQEYEGTDEIPVGGYHAVLQALQKYIFMNGTNRQHCSIHLKCPVQDIYYESSPRSSSASSRRRRGDSSGRMDSSEMTDDDEDDEDIKISGVRIEYTNESTGEAQTLKADCCVCTVPLGVLQRDIGFHPPLPLSQEQSIDTIGMGVLDKIMMLFPYKFWDDDWFAGITCDDPTRIQNFQDVSEDYGGKPILASLLGGNVARRFDDDDEGLTDEEVMAEVMSTLRILFGESETTNVPDPISYQISRWLCDPYSYGSYSFVKVGSTPEDYDRVAQPAGKTLFFAGEHTSKYHHSTVHGAWETGHREAVRLILKAKATAAARYI